MDFISCDLNTCKFTNPCKRYLDKGVKILFWNSLIPIFRSGALSKAPETFRARKAIAKSRTLRLQSCVIHVFLFWRDVPFIEELSFRRIHFSVFRYRWTKNGFMGPKRFGGFRETGPWTSLPRSLKATSDSLCLMFRRLFYPRLLFTFWRVALMLFNSHFFVGWPSECILLHTYHVLRCSAQG